MVNQRCWCFLFNDWLESVAGYGLTELSHNQSQVGILLLNKAWLCHSEQDRLKIGPGQDAIRAGLSQLEHCQCVLALGHHPLSWWQVLQSKDVKAYFGNREGVIYLSGHEHEEQAGKVDSGKHCFIALGTGSTFQAEEKRERHNAFQWIDLDFNRGLIGIEPYLWDRSNKVWCANSIASIASQYKTTGQATRW